MNFMQKNLILLIFAIGIVLGTLFNTKNKLTFKIEMELGEIGKITFSFMGMLLMLVSLFGIVSTLS